MKERLLVHKQKFNSYTSTFVANDSMMMEQYKLKIHHSKKVFDNAKKIGKGESCFQNSNIFYALLLSALYHDIGRFEQLKQYKTFSDILSCNHGYLGLKILRSLEFLKNEEKEIQKFVAMSVSLHNKFILPSSITGDGRNILLAIRDADKLDIFRILEGHLGKGAFPDPTVVMHLSDELGKYTPMMLDNMGKVDSISFKNMHYVNDFRLLLCHWVGTLHYSTTKSLLRKNNYIPSIIAGMEGLPEVQQKAFDYVHATLNI